MGDTPLLISLPMMGIINTVINVGANNVNPVSYAVKPNVRCANTGNTNTDVNNPRPTTNVKMVVKARLRLPSIFRFTAGFLILNSYQINPTRPTNANADVTCITVLLNQSSDSPLSNTYCKQPIPTVNKRIPV